MMLRLLRLLRGQMQLAHMTAAAEAELVIVDAASVVIQPLAVRAGHAAVYRAAGRGRRRGEVCRGAERRAGGGPPSTSTAGGVGCSCSGCGTGARAIAQTATSGYRRHRGQCTPCGTEHGGGSLGVALIRQ